MRPSFHTGWWISMMMRPSKISASLQDMYRFERTRTRNLEQAMQSEALVALRICDSNLLELILVCFWNKCEVTYLSYCCRCLQKLRRSLREKMFTSVHAFRAA